MLFLRPRRSQRCHFFGSLLGLETVAEGIETAEQATRLWHLGYRLGQGYHFGRPLPPHEVGSLLARTASDRKPVTQRAIA